jgi:hypothetical protein
VPAASVDTGHDSSMLGSQALHRKPPCRRHGLQLRTQGAYTSGEPDAQGDVPTSRSLRPATFSCVRALMVAKYSPPLSASLAAVGAKARIRPKVAWGLSPGPAAASAEKISRRCTQCSKVIVHLQCVGCCTLRC